MHTIGFEFERVRVERNAADGGGTVELFAELLLGNVANQRRVRRDCATSRTVCMDEANDALLRLAMLGLG
jgi:hypothetical protein